MTASSLPGVFHKRKLLSGKESCQHVIFNEGCKSVARAVLLPVFQINNYGIIDFPLPTITL